MIRRTVLFSSLEEKSFGARERKQKRKAERIQQNTEIHANRTAKKAAKSTALVPAGGSTALVPTTPKQVPVASAPKGQTIKLSPDALVNPKKVVIPKIPADGIPKKIAAPKKFPSGDIPKSGAETIKGAASKLFKNKAATAGVVTGLALAGGGLLALKNKNKK